MEKARIQTSGFGLIIALLVIAGALTYVLRFVQVEVDSMPDFTQIPMNYSGWNGEEVHFADVTYEILKATSTTMIRYEKENELIPGLFIAYFQNQKYGTQIHSPRHCLPGSGWGILSLTREKLNINGKTLPVNRVIIGSRDARQLVYYWFETRSGIITSEFGLKFSLFMNSLLLKPTDAAFVRLTVALPPGAPDEEGEKVLQNFLADFMTPIEKSLPFSST